MGEAEGLPIEEIKERFGLSDLWEEPFRRIAPNGESWAEFVTRACRGLDRLTREYADKTVVIVCHGGVIEASFIAFLGLNMLRQAIFVASQNTSITHWQKGTFEGQEGKWCLRRVNDHAHLLDLDASQRIPWEALAVKREQAPVSAPVAPEQ
jgi:probable phosphoglycerate mutase